MPLARLRGAAKEAADTLAWDPFCQAGAPTAYAALSCARFSLAGSLGGTSSSLNPDGSGEVRGFIPVLEGAATGGSSR